MAAGAADLAESVLPRTPYRQWVFIASTKRIAHAYRDVPRLLLLQLGLAGRDGSHSKRDSQRAAR